MIAGLATGPLAAAAHALRSSALPLESSALPLRSSALPLGDWQFWAVTLLALVAAGAVLRPLLPRRSKDSAACRGCPSGNDSDGGATKPKRVELTIGGKRVRR